MAAAPDAGLGATPLLRELGCDLSWLASAAEQQRRIEERVAAKDLKGLSELHPEGHDLVKPFWVADAGCKASDLQQLKRAAAIYKSSASDWFERYGKRLEDIVKEAKSEDQATSKAELLRHREEQLGRVAGSAVALRKVAHPKESGGTDEILAAKFEPEALRKMQACEKNAAREQLVAERLRGREEAACASAGVLVTASALSPKLAEVLAPQQRCFPVLILPGILILPDIESEAKRAMDARQKPQGVLDSLHRRRGETEKALEACRAAKKAGLAAGDGKRLALKKAHKEFQEAEEDYRRWYAENESYRLRIEELEASLIKDSEEVDDAEKEMQAADGVDAVHQRWVDCTVQRAEEFRGKHAKAAEVAVKNAAGTLLGAVLNASVAIELYQEVKVDKDAEEASLKSEKSSLGKQIEALETEVEEGCEDLLAMRTELAENKDKLSKVGDQILACARRRGEVDELLAIGQERLDSLRELRKHGLEIDEEQTSREAKRLAAEAYKRFQCFAAPKQSKRQEPPWPAAGCEALSALPAEMAAMVKMLVSQQLQEEKQAMMLQLRADLEVRGRAGSAASSEAGESAFSVVQDCGAVEHFSIGSDAGSSPSS